MSKVKALSKIARMIINDGNKAAERKFGKEAVKKTKSKEGKIIKKFKEADRRGFREPRGEKRSGERISTREALDSKRRNRSRAQDVFREPKIEEPLQFGKGGIVKKVIRQLRDDYKPKIKNEKETYSNVSKTAKTVLSPKAQVRNRRAVSPKGQTRNMGSSVRAGTDILPGMKKRSALARRKSVQTSSKPGSRRTKR